ncbi:TraR/DksA C4-type zinc finger protein [Desulforhopalus singaporensis]|uniref:RNA polymerase-binding protein DksA n=1 Tax=Desulforhopalus singaporensis TaxID=91360 RepID=A0A1H0M8I6_9BACT|nr:TraR/DksA C4-type zinc finger protein [Desulforhopalus singaporensis]SDO76723.1 RNA polymerase-binding protein DksA [Desulforhopalus singaporensis]
MASSQSGLAMALEANHRDRLKLAKIDRALDRVERREYGYCELTGEEIGLKRLVAQPLATLCIEAQEMIETRMRSHRVVRPEKKQTIFL